jgi:HK97 family phage prohead protease
MKRLYVEPTRTKVDRKNRTITHLISTKATDRAGDVVNPEGWVLDNFLKNPVVVANHDYSIQSIIGKAISLEVTPEGLVATTQFHDKGLGALAFDLVSNDMARAWSVGFKAIQGEPVKDTQGRNTGGMKYTKQELLEYSLVAVPMNPEAVTACVQRGLVSEQLAPKLFRSTPGGLGVADLERVWGNDVDLIEEPPPENATAEAMAIYGYKPDGSPLYPDTPALDPEKAAIERARVDHALRKAGLRGLR